ncbi:hypothetical protein EKU31_28445, partial [Bacillus anthracis]|nr:hypothetical protein [Bacillus anthracis]
TSDGTFLRSFSISSFFTSTLTTCSMIFFKYSSRVFFVSHLLFYFSILYAFLYHHEHRLHAQGIQRWAVIIQETLIIFAIFY